MSLLVVWATIGIPAEKANYLSGKQFEDHGLGKMLLQFGSTNSSIP